MMPYFVTTLCAMGQRLYVGDLKDNVSFVKYRQGTNQLVEFADGAIPRSITAMELLDYNTVVCGDKGAWIQRWTTISPTPRARACSGTRASSARLPTR